MSVMSFIQEGLYLGNADDAYKTDLLKQKGITHILTVEIKPLLKEATESFCYKYLHALDMESTDLLSHFQECIDFIEEGRKQGGVLVHCYAGQSRSATLVLAYLMHKLDMSLDDTMNLVMKLRPQIRPNDGFHSQLELFESMGNKLDTSKEQYKHYKLNNLAVRIQTAQIQGPLPEGTMTADPAGKGHTQGDILYKCKKCRRALFKSTNILPHVVGRGEMAFGWRSHITHTNEESQVHCKQSLFIEPVRWMENYILDIEGKFSCPKCQAKLGSFNWAGERCPCGTWVTPAFHIQTSKVDECQQRGPSALPPRSTRYATPAQHRVDNVKTEVKSSEKERVTLESKEHDESVQSETRKT